MVSDQLTSVYLNLGILFIAWKGLLAFKSLV